MISVRPIMFNTPGEASEELERIGFSPSQAASLASQTACLHLRMEGLQDAVIQSLEETARALNTRLIIPPCSGNHVKRPTLLLSGTPFQVERFAAAIEKESPDLHEISVVAKGLLENIGKTQFTIACRTRTLRLGQRTLIMGAINVTPDSFSDGAEFLHPDRAVARALEMVEEGVDLIDIGGESTRPGSRGTAAEEELRRVIPIIQRVSAETDTPISVDTRKARVAVEALDAGCQIINDVSALRSDPEMAHVVASHDVPVVLMHMRGTPDTMQQEIHYKSLISEILQYLKESMDLARGVGVNPEKIIIDPGIGFGKTVDHNLAIIKHLIEFRILGRPILIGTSRKSFIGKILGVDVGQREEGTVATVAVSILNGAHIIRTHNVRNAVRAARMIDAVRGVSIPEV